jgi:sulfur carrier protein ThiS
MKVFFKSIADLRDYFGREPVELELPEGATLFNLLDEIAVRWGPGLPKYLWDAEKNQFRGPIVLLVNKKVYLDHSMPLIEGQEITAMKAIAGGSCDYSKK